jgi:hypothetical protein
MVMDTANKPAGDLVIGVDACPACGGELVRDQIKGALRDPMEIPSGKVPVHLIHRCKCGWCVSFLPSHWSGRRSIDIIVVNQSGIELPTCFRGHSLAWSVQRRLGSRLDLQCVQFQVDRLLQCNDIRSIWIGGVPSGFLSKPGIYNATKAIVLQSFWQNRERGLTFAELRSQTGLTAGQLLGYLKRATSAKIQLIEKADEVYQPPNKMVALYKITPAGIQWIRWAIDQGYYVGA